MDIKEIALKITPGYWKRDQWNIEYFDSVGFAEALIESYKAELLKEVGEPFGHIGKDILGRWNLCLAGQGWKDETAIYTADQLIAATKPLEDQLAKAEQLWQVAQGRCDGLEEKLAKAEQRVAEWQPIDTAPKDGTRVLLCIDHGEWGDKVWTGLWGDGWMVSYGKARTEPTHWMPLPKAPANGESL